MSVNWPVAGEDGPPSEAHGMLPPEGQAGGVPAGSHHVDAQRFQVEMPGDVYAEATAGRGALPS